MFRPNYSTPGKGVNKRDPNQPRITTFFEILPRKLWNLLKANLLYLVSALPFFAVTMLISGVISSRIVNMLNSMLQDSTLAPALAFCDLALRAIFSVLFTVFLGQGPATAGITHIIRSYANETHCWLFSDFAEKAKRNLKQGLCMWLIDLAVFYVLAVAFIFYIKSASYIMIFFLSFAAIVYIIMHIYIYPIMITFNLPLRHILRNSLIFSFENAPKNLLLLIIMLVLHVGIPCFAWFWFNIWTGFFVFFLSELFIMPALTSFITNFFIHPSIEKYINLANETQNTQN